MEAIDVIRAFSDRDELRGFLRGNVIKYVLRYDRKGGVEDLRKARWYLDALIDVETDRRKGMTPVEMMEAMASDEFDVDAAKYVVSGIVSDLEKRSYD